MSLCVLRAASRLHERIAYTKLLPAHVIQSYRKQQYENQALKKTVRNVFTRNMATDVPDDRRLNTEGVNGSHQKKEVLLIDVRGREEVKLTVRIPQSLNIPVSEFTTAMKVPDQMFKQKYGFDKPKPDDPVVFICTTGARSYIALRNALEWATKSDQPVIFNSFSLKRKGWSLVEILAVVNNITQLQSRILFDLPSNIEGIELQLHYCSDQYKDTYSY